MKRKIYVDYKAYPKSKLLTFLSYMQSNFLIGWIILFMPLLVVTFIIIMATQSSVAGCICGAISFFLPILIEGILKSINLDKIAERKFNKNNKSVPDEDLVLMHKTPDGRYICVPASKAKDVLEEENSISEEEIDDYLSNHKSSLKDAVDLFSKKK